MPVRSAFGLALVLLLAGCASQGGYSGSRVETPVAAGRSQYIVVGKILSLKVAPIPENTFFRKVFCQVQVVQRIRGMTPDLVTITYMLEGDSGPPFGAGDTCVFCIVDESAVNPGEYMAAKVLKATPDNIAQVKGGA